MLAMNYRGPYRVRAQQKVEPKIEHANDAIVKVTRSCICGYLFSSKLDNCIKTVLIPPNAPNPSSAGRMLH